MGDDIQMSTKSRWCAVAVVIGLAVACSPRIRDECDPDKAENGCETPKTGLVCVGTSSQGADGGTPDAGNPDDVNTFFCEKPCTALGTLPCARTAATPSETAISASAALRMRPDAREMAFIGRHHCCRDC